MNTIKRLILALCAFFITGLAFGQDTVSTYSITLDFPYTTKYVFRGLETTQGTFQPSIGFERGAFYAGVWGSEPVDSGFTRELDYTIGFAPEFKGLTLDIGATLYHYPEDREHTLEGYVGVFRELGDLTLGGKVYRDFDLKTTTYEATAEYTVLIVDLTTAVGTVRAGSDSYTYWSAGASVPYTFKRATFTAGINYASHDIDGEAKGHVWYTFGVGFGL